MKAPAVKQALLSSKALSAFSTLMDELEPSTANEALKNAIAAMVRRYSDKK
jgi:hypothetical protein